MIRNLKDLKKYKRPTGDEIGELYADMPVSGQDEQWARQVAKDIREFPGAYVRCMDVFYYADPKYKSAMNRVLAFMLWANEANGHDKELWELGVERAINQIQNLTKQYFDEAEAVRRGLSRDRRGRDTRKILEECINGFKERPPSACALAVLAFQPTVENMQAALANLSKRGASGKHAKHTEPDKALVRECWLEWQANPILYKNKASFDRDMLEKMQKIEDIRTITKWRIDLQKAHTPS